MPPKVGGISVSRRDVTLQLRRRVARVARHTLPMDCGSSCLPKPCRGSVGGHQTSGRPKNVGGVQGRSAKRRDVTLQLRRRVARVARDTTLWLPGLPTLSDTHRHSWRDVWWRKRVQLSGKASPSLATDAIRCPVPCLVGWCSLDIRDKVKTMVYGCYHSVHNLFGRAIKFCQCLLNCVCPAPSQLYHVSDVQTTATD